MCRAFPDRQPGGFGRIRVGRHSGSKPRRNAGYSINLTRLSGPESIAPSAEDLQYTPPFLPFPVTVVSTTGGVVASLILKPEVSHRSATISAVPGFLLEQPFSPEVRRWLKNLITPGGIRKTLRRPHPSRWYAVSMFSLPAAQCEPLD